MHVPAEGNPHADIAIVGMGPGRWEENRGRPFCGDSGQLLDRMLTEAGLSREDLWVTNVSLCRPDAVEMPNGGTMPKARVEKDSMLKHCRERVLRELGRVKPKVVVALGTITAEALCDDVKGITQLHGSLNHLSAAVGHDSIVIPLFHPAHLLRGEQRFYPAVVAGLRKAKRLARDGVKSPGSLFLIDPASPTLMKDLDVLDTLVEDIIRTGEDISWDVETFDATPRVTGLTVVGFGSAARKLGVAITVRVWNALRGAFEWVWSRSLWERLYNIIARLWRARNCKLLWNFGFDVTVMERFWGPVGGTVRDGMILHHLDFPDTLHRLDFAVQTELDVPPWKYLYRQLCARGVATHRDLLVYNAQDCLYTALVFPLVERNARLRGNIHLEQHQLRVADLARRAHINGIPINHPVLEEIYAKHQKARDEALATMHAAIAAHEGAPESLRQWLDAAKAKRAAASGKTGALKPTPSLTATDWNPNAGDHGRWFLYDFLRLQPTRFTAGGPEKDEKKKLPSHSYKGVLVYMSNPLVKAYVDRAEEEAVLRTLDTIRKNLDPVTRWLHASWSTTSMKGTRWTSHPNCFDEETELLTPRGWVRVSALRADDEIAQWSPKGDLISFVRPLQLIKRTYDGPMVAIKNRGVDLFVTPEHRLVFWHTRNRHKGGEAVLEEWPAADAGHAHTAVPQVLGEYLGGWVDESAAFITVLCAAQADGWRRRYGPGQAWAWYLTRQRKVDRLIAALTALGDAASWYTKPVLRRGRRSQTAVYLRDCPLKKKLDVHLNNRKDFDGARILAWSQRTLRRFVEEVPHWDGTVAGHAGPYSSTNRHNADWVQIAQLLSGGGRVGHLYPSWSKQSKRPCWNLTPGWRNGRVGVSLKHVMVAPPERRTVYCVTVPSSYVVVRRNTYVAITGQCQNWTEEIKRITLLPDPWVWVGADAAAIEYRIAAYLARIPELLTLFNGPMFDEEKEKWKKYDPRYDGHSLIATEVFGDVFTNGTPELKAALRTMVKRVVYALFYGAFPEKIFTTILEDHRVPSDFRAFVSKHPEYIIRIHEGFSARFPDWDRFAQREIVWVRMLGEQMIAPFNRHRPWALPNLVEETKIRNTPIQLAAGEVVNALFLAMDAEARAQGIRCWFAVHAHDACEWVVHKDDAERMKALINSIFDCTLEMGRDGTDVPFRRIHIYGQAKIGHSLAEV